MDLAEIVRVYSLGYLVVLYLFSFCRTAPKQLHWLNLNLLQLLILKNSTYYPEIFIVYFLG